MTNLPERLARLIRQRGGFAYEGETLVMGCLAGRFAFFADDSSLAPDMVERARAAGALAAVVHTEQEAAALLDTLTAPGDVHATSFNAGVWSQRCSRCGLRWGDGDHPCRHCGSVAVVRTRFTPVADEDERGCPHRQGRGEEEG